VRKPQTPRQRLRYETLDFITLELGYSSTKAPLTLEERHKIGSTVEQILKGEKEAARAPPAELD
jgi:DOPA 4,5-dioxygenase